MTCGSAPRVKREKGALKELVDDGPRGFYSNPARRWTRCTGSKANRPRPTAADQALQRLDGTRPGPDAAAVRRAVDACPASLTRVVVGGYDVSRGTAAVAHVVHVVRVDGALFMDRATSGRRRSPFPPGWLDEPSTPDAGGRPPPADATLRLRAHYTNNSGRTTRLRLRRGALRMPARRRMAPGEHLARCRPPPDDATANATRARSTPNACA